MKVIPDCIRKQVEAAMYAAVKLHLVKALEDSKLAKKDKWVKDNAGQCVIRYVLRTGLCYLF